MTQQFIKINSEGIQYLNDPPEKKFSFEDRNTEAGIRGDLTLEIHGKNFLAQHQLTVDDALGLIAILGYNLREKLYIPQPTRKTP
jgi:hypothetical protein